MEKIIYANGTAEVLVPAGQKIVIATYGNGYATISFKRGNDLEFIQRLDNAQVILGPYTDIRTVNVQALQDQVAYDVGTNPGLESNVRANFNGSGVVDSFRVGDQSITFGGGSGSGLVTGRTITVGVAAVLTDAGTIVQANAAIAIAVTIPNDSTVAWTADSVIAIYQVGSGVASFAAGSGVTLRVPTSYATSVQYDTIFARRVGANEWVVSK